MRRSIVSLSGILLIASSLWAGAQAGELRVVGTGDGLELLRALGAAYTADNPDTVVIAPPSIGSGGGLAAVGSDKEMLARVARPLTESERSSGLVAKPFLRLPSAFFVHPSAGVETISAEQLSAIYAGDITNWSEVGGADLRIKVVRREEIDSTLSVLRQTMPGWKDLVLTEKSKLATTTQESIDTVKEVEGAIGFGPYTRFLEPDVRILSVDELHPIDPAYPTAVTVMFVFKTGRLSGEAQSFVDYAVSPKARTLIASMGGVPLSE